MKNTLLFLLLLFSAAMHSQIIELQKLSNGELVQGQPLFNKTQDDIYGYLFIFKKDKLDKKEFLYEYTLLDKNLNKVLSGEFTEILGNYGKSIDVNGIYREGFISFKIDEMYSEYAAKIRSRYRVLDIKTNSLSDAFVLDENLDKVYNEEPKSARKSTVFTFWPNSFGYSLTTPVENNIDRGLFAMTPNTMLEAGARERGIYYFNEQLDPVWSLDYNEDATKKKYEEISFLNNKNHSDVLVGRRYFNGSKNENLREKGELFNTFLFLNKDSGELINEFSPYGLKQSNRIEAKDISTINVYMNSNERVVFLNRIMNTKSKKFVFDEEKIIGFSKSEYEISTGKEISRNFFTWDKLSKHLSIDEYGYIKEKGEPNSYLYFHDAILKSNGNIIFVTEQYRTLSGTIMVAGSQGVKINDMILFEVDKNMDLVQYKRVSKDSKNIRNGVKMQGTSADYFGAFDYSGYQDLGDDNYIFFYFNKQRPGEGGRKQRVLGIISSLDGVLKEQKLPLKSNDGSELSIAAAKKGYILIMEKFRDKKKGVEMRLEKVN